MDICVSHTLTREPSVLVVNDEPSVRRLLSGILRGCGYRATLAADGVEARTAIETEAVAVVLCDIHLQGESSLALVQDLRRRSPHTVVLMMSGDGVPDQTYGALDEGISGYVAKPFDAKDVANRIAQALCGRCLRGAPVYREDTFPWQQRQGFTNA